MYQNKIFRAYDIRGEAFTDFDEDGFMRIAFAIAQHVKNKTKKDTLRVFVSGDARQSMSALYPAVISGLETAGCHITWGGSIPTPVNYFAFHEGDFDLSIQISASHNPAPDNGLKMTDREGSICGDQIQAIKNIVKDNQATTFGQPGVCENDCQVIPFQESYTLKLLSLHKLENQKHLIIDAGNAIPGVLYPTIYRKFNQQITEIHTALDTTFPNHQPDPERPENLQDLINAVKENQAHYGLAFDGDGDRVGIVNVKGEIYSADKILYVLAIDHLSRYPGASIVVDAMSSDILHRKIKEKGGHVIISKTGHSFIEEAMHKHNAMLGGEQSGHMMFGEDFYGHDDACLAGIRFLKALENNPQLETEITETWPKMAEFSEKFTVPDEQKFQILENYVQHMLKKFPEANTLDGIRISFGNDAWAIVRCSNTSPKISVRIESANKQALAWLQDSLQLDLILQTNAQK